MRVPPVCELFEFENALWETGYKLIGGIDEAGRGPLAGPVVSACVVIDKSIRIEGVFDSKSLSEKKRNYLFDMINDMCISVSTGFADHTTIDRINIYNAAKVSMQAALSNSAVSPEYVLTDAMKLDITIPHKPIIKGDTKSFAIAAASIIAKVTRDRYMEHLHHEYPVYNWSQNKGYPTREHREAIKAYGPSPYHRTSFRLF